MLYKKIILDKDQKIFFTSDTHWNHKNICSATSEWDLEEHGGHTSVRNFDSLEQMNSTIISGINNTVGQDDWLIHLGDWSFGGFDSIQKFRDRLLVKNIVLVLGNHDHHQANNRENVRDLFESVYSLLELTVSDPAIGKRTYMLGHYPMYIWNKAHHGRISLHGHTHASFVHPNRS